MSNPHAYVVDLGGEPSIRNVAELRDRLTAAIAEHDSIVVSAEAAVSADISILQLLAAAHRTASTAGKTISLAYARNGTFEQALMKAGLLSPDGEPLTREGTFWTPSAAAKDEAA